MSFCDLLRAALRAVARVHRPAGLVSEAVQSTAKSKNIARIVLQMQTKCEDPSTRLRLAQDDNVVSDL